MAIKNNEELFIFSRMVNGDKKAFRFFFDKYYTCLCNFANTYIRDPDMSEEIVQGIYVYFWENREKISIEISVESYLLRAAKYKSLNYIRNNKIREAIHEKLYEFAETNYEMPVNVISTSQLREIIERSVNSLPERCREIYILGKEKNLTYKEIASELNISVKTVENQMGKALKRLREMLKPYYKEIFIFLLAFLVF